MQGLKATAQGTALVSQAAVTSGRHGTALKRPWCAGQRRSWDRRSRRARRVHGSASQLRCLLRSSQTERTSDDLYHSGAFAGRYECSAVTPGKNKAVLWRLLKRRSATAASGSVLATSMQPVTTRFRVVAKRFNYYNL